MHLRLLLLAVVNAILNGRVGINSLCRFHAVARDIDRVISHGRLLAKAALFEIFVTVDIKLGVFWVDVVHLLVAWKLLKVNSIHGNALTRVWHIQLLVIIEPVLFQQDLACTGLRLLLVGECQEFLLWRVRPRSDMKVIYRVVYRVLSQSKITRANVAAQTILMITGNEFVLWIIGAFLK